MSNAVLSSRASWLPKPLMESYLHTGWVELMTRERIRVEAGDPVSWAARRSPSCAAAYCTTVAEAPENARFNRYSNIMPYDRSRVILPSGAYVNASWVKELAGGRWTVATQAPLDRTVHSFLSMFLLPVSPPQSSDSSVAPEIPSVNRLRTIVQLTPNVEGRAQKAFKYFPNEIGEEIVWPPPPGVQSPPVKVKLVQVKSPEEEKDEPSWIHSVLELSHEGGQGPPHLVRHLHYLGWPDHGVPKDVRSLLQFMMFVDACNTDSTHPDAAVNPEPPIVVGCSAGVGRTGTYIALRSILHGEGLIQPPSEAKDTQPKAIWTGAPLQPSPLGAVKPEFSEDKIILEVDALREQRTMMVQTIEQIKFLYTTIAAAMDLGQRQQ
ncbi:hypothetical protein FS842_004722 [Serendipita sp. 407]|nr:hypothetical protein FRC15_008956 [Serendipita sp. 397]KAG8796907.1 hypothetical protein FRC16_009395 [Serendipita sp. 398]KAG8865500.1 hypothetical protein FRC20_009768 [Serendipita sp. 405]KAG9054589.1 hypothetical protein FS842_004722 [Serendipita sp. 407]